MKIHRLTGILSICACLVVTTVIPGCGGSKPTGGLRGKVTYKGDPVAAAKVQIQSSVSGVAGTGNTDASGNYRIDTALPLGSYSVAVMSTETPPPPPLPKGYVAKDNPKIPKKYRTATTSGLTVEVKAGTNEFNIPMAD